MSHAVTINRDDVWRVLDMPGLTRIDFWNQREATLTFHTADGADPVERSFIVEEVMRMGARVRTP